MSQAEKFDFSIIRNLRMKWGISAQELAKKANMTRATVVKIESGQGNPTIETIRALASVFQLDASQLICMAELSTSEQGKTSAYGKDGFKGFHVCFPNFEIYHLRAEPGAKTVSDPNLHNNTAEICLVLSGRIRIKFMGDEKELGPQMSIRFKALHEHHLETIVRSEIILIHHNLP